MCSHYQGMKERDRYRRHFGVEPPADLGKHDLWPGYEGILDQADALRAKRREALAQLDSLTQSIFIEMFGEPTKETTMMDIAAIQYELKQLLGIAVDVLTPKALPDSFRAQVIKQAQPV